jgi:hypothetical protein
MMKTTRFLDYDCACIENAALSLLVTQSVGPRIISLRLQDGDNLLAVLPDFVTQRPDGKLFHFYGGHRLWLAPEHMPRTYVLDDYPVRLTEVQDGLIVVQPVEEETGIEKSMRISLVRDKARVVIRHTLTNRGSQPVECSPWAITQFRTGGVAVLPQSREQTQMLPNRNLVLWPYSRINSSQVRWGDQYILVRGRMETAFKIGFANPRGWLAYWLEGSLFVKRAKFEPQASYYDYGSSSELYCNGEMLELETLGPSGRLEPEQSVTHEETWELYAGVACPEDQESVQRIVEELGLE